MDFESYCIGKKIDFNTFKKEDNERFTIWESEFMQMHPNSFTSQKLFYINEIRRRYPLAVIEKPKEVIESITPKILKNNDQKTNDETIEPQSGVEAAKPKIAKPVIKPVIKKVESTETPTNITNSETPSDKKPIMKPVIKPIMKKPPTE